MDQAVIAVAAILVPVLRGLYVASCFATTIVLAHDARCALTKHAGDGDFGFLLFWLNAVNRLWFTLYLIHFNDPSPAATASALLAACYIFGLAQEAGTLLLWWWHRGREVKA